MPYELQDLVVTRVDLVDEGANSAAFIELYKRKETNEPMDFEAILKSLKPEHAAVVRDFIATKDADIEKARNDLRAANQSLTDVQGQLKSANDALVAANAEIKTLKAKEYCECDGEEDADGMCKACGKPKKKSAAFDETETLKSMPEPARALFLKMRAQKEAAEEQVRKNNEEKAEAEAVAKAASLKALPIEQAKLVGILKSCTPEVVDLLSTVNKAIEATVLDEIGKNAGNGAASGVPSTSDEAWEALEKKAHEIAKRDNVTVEKAMGTALSENPDLYLKYLNGGAK